MSNTLAIGAVTATLRNLLQAGIADEPGGIHVETMPPDKAVDVAQMEGPARLNLFLYQSQMNGAWRNHDLPDRVRPNENGHPPLAVDLHYLVTAYEKVDGDPALPGHRLLGRAMRVLHDHTVLGADEIRSALPNNDLWRQVERVRITPHPVSMDEISKLWTAFQTAYRFSVAYQVSVVLIESLRPTRAPLPVLSRGAMDAATGRDAGVTVQASLVPPFPHLDQVEFPPNRSDFVLGDLLVLTGHHLDGAQPKVVFEHPLLDFPITLDPIVQQPDRIEVNLTQNPASDAASWPAGYYMVSVAFGQGPSRRLTNRLAFALVPSITISPPQALPGPLNLTCVPQVRLAPPGQSEFEQTVALLFGSEEFRPEIPPQVPPSASSPTMLTFLLPSVPTGTYYARLRVDGVDSRLVTYLGSPAMPGFDPNLQVLVP